MNWDHASDVYRHCFGIETTQALPNHYELLGLQPYRVTPQQVDTAVERRLQQLRALSGVAPIVLQQLQDEIDAARSCLAEADRKRGYDRQLQRALLVAPVKALDGSQVRTGGHSVMLDPVAQSLPKESRPSERPGSPEPANSRENVGNGYSLNHDTASLSDHPSLEVPPLATEIAGEATTGSLETRDGHSHPNYEILREIGRGASSVVYQAYDRILRRYVAIKELNERFHMDRHESELFWKEARFLASIQHENIIRIHGVDQSRRWIILELMKGDLQSKLQDGPMPPELVRSVLRQILEGLRFLHSRNVLHGEVKLGNMLIDEHGRVRLSDSPGFTHEGEFRLPTGSLRHVAPELLKPQSFGPVGPGVDLYSLGLAAIELLLGGKVEQHFKGVTGDGEELNLAWLRWHSSSNERVPSIRELVDGVPEDLATVIDGLTRKHPDQRYASAEEALCDLADEPILLINPNVSSSGHSFLDAVANNSSTARGVSKRTKSAASSRFAALTRVKERFGGDRTRLPILAAVVGFLIVLGLLLLTGGSGPKPLAATDLSKSTHTVVRILTNVSATGRVGQGSEFATPVELELPPGVYELQIYREGYQSISTEVEVGTTPQDFEFSLVPLLPAAKTSKLVQVESFPSRAALRIDGADRGATPYQSELNFGTHSLEVSLPGYQARQLDITVDEHSGPVVVDLLAAAMPINVTFASVPEEATLRINGEHIGKTTAVHKLAPGNYEIDLVLDNYRPYHQSIVVNADNRDFRFDLSPLGTAASPSESASASPNDMPRDQMELEELLSKSRQGLKPVRISVVGGEMSERAKTTYVSLLTRMMEDHWDSPQGREELKKHYYRLAAVADDPRLVLALGLIFDKQNDPELALECYEIARNHTPQIPYFAAWRRSILLRMQRRRAGDLARALVESVQLAEALVDLSQQSGVDPDRIDPVIAVNVEFLGKLMGLLEQLASVESFRLTLSLNEDNNRIRNALEQLSSRYNYELLYEHAKTNVQGLYQQRRQAEQVYDEMMQKRIENEKSPTIRQGEREQRRWLGFHIQAPKGVDYYDYEYDLQSNNNSGSFGFPYFYYLPWQNYGGYSNDTKWNTKWKMTDLPEGRRAPRESEHVRGYFEVDLEQERERLIDTFPSQPIIYIVN